MSDSDVGYDYKKKKKSNNDNNVNDLPPGFRFDPTDEELLVHFLHRKASLLPCNPDVIPDLDLCPFDPWELNGKALNEGKQWYFYSRRIKKRITSNGHWKAITGSEECVQSRCGSKQIGIKKQFVFCVGEAPVEVKTNWILEEFRLNPDSSASSSRPSKSRTRQTDHSKWVICKVYERNSDDSDDGTQLSCMDEVYLSLDDLDEISLPHFNFK